MGITHQHHASLDRADTAADDGGGVAALHRNSGDQRLQEYSKRSWGGQCGSNVADGCRTVALKRNSEAQDERTAGRMSDCLKEGSTRHFSMAATTSVGSALTRRLRFTAW